VVLAVYSLLALWLTRPLVWHIFDSSLVDYLPTRFDIPLCTWVLSWDTHALTTRPSALFDANIYHPAPDALAYTEHMLGSVPFFAPVYLATGNPALGLNVMILCGLVLSAAGTYLLVLRWTGSHTAAFFSGLVFGFYPAHLRATGPNLQTLQYFPMILWALDAVLAGGGLGATAALGVALLGQCLASFYYAYPAVLATVAAAGALCLTRRSRPSRVALLRVAAAVCFAGVAMALVSRPYFRVAARGQRGTIYVLNALFGAIRMPVLEMIGASLTLLGPAPVVLAIVGACSGLWRGTDDRTRRRVVILLVWILVGHLLFVGRTLGVAQYSIAMPSRLLIAYLPGFSALRDRRRFLVLVAAAGSVLAGMGLAALGARFPSRYRQWIAPVALATAATLGLALGVSLRPCSLVDLPTGARVPDVYRALAARPPGPVLELPVGATTRAKIAPLLQAQYEYFSTFHWRPLLNGYASYWPGGFENAMKLARALPRASALRELVACAGLRWIVLHTDRLDAADIEAWQRLEGVDPPERFGADLLFHVTLPPPAGGCREELYPEALRSDATPGAGAALRSNEPVASQAG